jgi:hypothetical protein
MSYIRDNSGREGLNGLGETCPEGSRWIASRSMPGGGTCMTAAQYAAMVRGTVPRDLRTQALAIPAAVPASGGGSTLLLGVAALLGLGVGGYFLLRKKTAPATSAKKSKSKNRHRSR